MKKLRLLLLAIIALLAAALLLVRPYVDYLWLESLGQAPLFWTRAWAALAVFSGGFFVGALAVAAQLVLASRLWQAVSDGPPGPLEVEVKGTRVRVFSRPQQVPGRIVAAWAAVGGGVVGLSCLPLAMPALMFVHRAPFGKADPIFGHDVSFYVFVLPLLQGVLDRLVLALVVSSGVAAAFYGSRGLSRAVRGWRLPSTVGRHAQALAGSALLLGAASLTLARWNLVVDGRGLAAGAGYVDVAVRMPALVLTAAACVVGALVLILGRASLVRTAAVLGLVGVLAFLGLGVAPGATQAWAVRPNEIAVERPYLEHGIRSTLEAFGLDDVTVHDYPAEPSLTAAQVERNQSTVENVRLWDPGPLLQTYQQIQALRQYYAFPDADVDRYIVDGRLRQVMLAAREVDRGRLDERTRTWVNLRLKYTHGYGVAMSPVNAFTPGDGLPVLWIRDLPPKSVPGLELEQPALYYGEDTDWYVLANTTEGELDYPKGDTNIYSHYQGRGGVPLGGLGRRLALALYFGDFNLLISQALTPTTRVLFHRDVPGRLRRLAPFLGQDGDPYPVVSDGRIRWIADLYTGTGRHPYSARVDGLNYVRNPAKAVVDAFDGSVRLAVVDPEEPILRTWRSAFPSLFVDEDTLEPAIRDHFRYPEDLFRLQAEIYQTFHMTEPEVFYNKEDVWAVPTETFEGRQVEMEPYYVVMQLPEEDSLEFVLMLPFTPRGKDNMVSWMGARNDGAHRGKLVLYRFPKERLVYGPAQIEARIDQDPVISQQLSLWDQRGSRVIRGNLLVIPLEGSLVYFEPLYLQGSEKSIPELKRVLVAVGDRVVMEPTLEAALASALAGQPAAARKEPRPPAPSGAASAPAPAASPPPPPAEGAAPPATRALEHYRLAEEALQRGDWAAYGREMGQVKALLEEMNAGEGGP